MVAAPAIRTGLGRWGFRGLGFRVRVLGFRV